MFHILEGLTIVKKSPKIPESYCIRTSHEMIQLASMLLGIGTIDELERLKP